ncbi:MAG TPA: hypothetical protein VNI78_07955, partial [Vicinamibacterales bacterium]|nr:hypothetical protein [Vicinamibacterales bacterium]
MRVGMSSSVHRRTAISQIDSYSEKITGRDSPEAAPARYIFCIAARNSALLFVLASLSSSSSI